VPDATAGLIDLLKPDVDLEVRHQARARSGSAGSRGTWSADLRQAEGQRAQGRRALALLIGADADTAARALATYERLAPEAMEELKDVYNQTFGYWSDKNYENGDVARWVENAEACAHVKVHDALQDWPKLLLSRASRRSSSTTGRTR
jgi:hypothetical protein